MSPEKQPAAEADAVLIKKYANRRLYNTDTSSYVTLEELYDMVRQGTDFKVVDAKTGEDLTQQILTQIIVEQESRGANLLPIAFLRSLIRLYGGEMQGVLPHYLEVSMENFTRNQQKLTETFAKTIGASKGYSPFSQFEEWNKQNAALFQQAMSMFNPFDKTKTK